MFSCSPEPSPESTKTPGTQPRPGTAPLSPENQTAIDQIARGMSEYMEGGTASYTKEHIEKCRSILTGFANSIMEASDKKAGSAVIKSTVIALNTLNHEAGGGLIETDQREDICSFINGLGAERGFQPIRRRCDGEVEKVVSLQLS